ncbi:Mor transcription activator family protein [compost metagenome]
MVYIPKGVSIQASKLHQQIYDDWTGHNHHEVATKHGVSVQYVYRVIKRMRAVIIARDQGDLFDKAST